ncbi:MAG: glycosyltransferase family 9 protein [Myxococcota bacterium]
MNSSASPCRFGPARRIAVLRALQLGDLLCAVPALRALKAAHPKAKITLVGLPLAREFVRRYRHYVDGFLELPGYPGLSDRPPDVSGIPAFLMLAQAQKFDVVIQMQGTGNALNTVAHLMGGRRTAGYYQEGDHVPDRELFMLQPVRDPEVRQHLKLLGFLGVPSRGEHLEFPLSDAEVSEASGLMSAHGLLPGRYALVHPGARLLSRRWAPERFAAVADQLNADGLRVVLTGTAEERPITAAVRGVMRTSAVDLAGCTTVGGVAALVRHARLVVSNDTALSHIAAAMRVASVIVANGSDPMRWAPLDRNLHKVLYHPIECRPCTHATCPIGHPCANAVQPDHVMQQAHGLLRQVPPG